MEMVAITGKTNNNASLDKRVFEKISPNENFLC